MDFPFRSWGSKIWVTFLFQPERDDLYIGPNPLPFIIPAICPRLSSPLNSFFSDRFFSLTPISLSFGLYPLEAESFSNWAEPTSGPAVSVLRFSFWVILFLSRVK